MMYITQAKKIAETIVATLKPHCRIINIAGSIRREKSEVKDIEIVCLPKTQTIGGSSSLFEVSEPETIVHPDFVKAVKCLGKIVKGKPDVGKYVQIETNWKINLDLFIPDDFDYYRQYAIRTGSADYAQKVIAGGWLKIGWCGSDKGLRKQSDCECTKQPDGKNKWKCINPKAQKPPVWSSENDFFEWLGVPLIEPKERVLTHYQY